MNEIIDINQKQLIIKEYKGQRIVTLRDIDEVHNRPDGTARKAFNRNKNRFNYGEDYFVHEMDEAKTLFGIIAPKGLTSLTESGYLMVTKVFDDDLSWDIQRQLVNTYFKAKEIQPVNQQVDYSSIMFELTSLKNEIQSMKYLTNRQQTTKQYSKWKQKTIPKIKLLAEYFEETQLTILRNLYIELEDLYNIDLNEYKADYCFEMSLDNCSQFDVIENNKNLRDMFDLLINSLLDKYELSCEIEENKKRKTIFD